VSVERAGGGPMSAPVLRDGDLTVVLDGVDRLRWSRQGVAEWSLYGLWPTGEERRDLLERLAEGHPVLVILEQGPSTVSVYRQEVATGLDRFASVIESDPLLELAVPVLDWLPEPLADRGRRFVVRSDELVRTTARALLPTLIVDDEAAGANLRFARRTARSGSGIGCLDAARQVFASRSLAAAGAGAP
jgi:hypothetical protein